MLFAVLRCADRNERSDLLDFTLRTISDSAMADSGDSEAKDRATSPSRRRDRKRVPVEALTD